jgi:16S rRNA (guanine966-N2)-methyltransferase
VRIIAGEWGGRTIQAPAGRDVRPTADRVREAWMSALGDRVRGANVLDLFAGSGALGLEALSRGARTATLVERGRTALRALDRNVESLGAAGRCRIVRGDAFRFLDRPGEAMFDLAFADPPYDRGYAFRLLTRMQSAPFARELWVEHRSNEEIPALPELLQRRYGDTTLSIWKDPE